MSGVVRYVGVWTETPCTTCGAILTYRGPLPEAPRCNSHAEDIMTDRLEITLAEVSEVALAWHASHGRRGNRSFSVSHFDGRFFLAVGTGWEGGRTATHRDLATAAARLVRDMRADLERGEESDRACDEAYAGGVST